MARASVHFVAERSVESLPPPLTSSGAIGWIRANLLSSPLNIALTLLCAYLVWLVVPPVIEWAFVKATFVGTSRADCTAGGACWVFIEARFGQFMYGFYPEGERWRVNLAFGLLILALIPLFLPRFPQKIPYAIGLIVIYPIIAFILFRGGMLGLESVETARWGGLFLTLVIAGVGLTTSLPFGIILALGRRSAMPVIRTLSVVFIELVRGVPLITVLFMASVMLPLFLPEGMDFNKLMRALVGFSMFAAAYMAETIRGGLQAIPKGQYEAADALGLGYWQGMGFIVLPQALKLVIPGIVNIFISFFKDTSLVLIIGLFDFLQSVRAGTQDANWVGLSTEGYVFAAVVYFIFCFAMSRYSMSIERKLDTGHKH